MLGWKRLGTANLEDRQEGIYFVLLSYEAVANERKKSFKGYLKEKTI